MYVEGFSSTTGDNKFLLLQYEVMCRRGDHPSRSVFGTSPICFDLSRAGVACLVDAYSNKKRTTLKGTAAMLRCSQPAETKLLLYYTL
jgi:hypothetical protein